MFLYPQKPKLIFNVDIVPNNYIVQIKKNGWRVEIECDGKYVKLFNRKGNKLSRGDENNWQFIKDLFPSPFYLDGEVLGTRQMGNNLNCIVIWDAPVFDGQVFTKLPYIERYQKLQKFVNNKIMFINDDKKYGTLFIGEHNGFGLYLSCNYNKKEWPILWNKILNETKEYDKIKQLTVNEGLVFKNPNAENLWGVKTIEHVNQLKFKVKQM